MAQVLHLAKWEKKMMLWQEHVRVINRNYFKIMLAICGLFSAHLTVAGLAQSVERLTAERGVAGSIPGAGPLLRVLKWLRNEGTPFALQAARPSRSSDDHVEWRSRLH